MFMEKLANQFSNNTNDILDLRDKSNHPITFTYSEIFKYALLEVKIQDCIILPGFKLNQNAPFYLAALKGIQYDNFDDSFNAVKYDLNQFYSNFKPKNLVDWFQLTDTSNLKHFEIQPWGAILPWRARGVNSFIELIKNATINDNIKDGLKGGIEMGWAYCGPVDQDKLHVEAMRITNLIYSIREKGYLRSNDHDGDIIATALINNKMEWKCLITNGYHRACVLAAFGYNSFPLRINLVIRQDEVKFWPHVLDGFYSEIQAKHIFNKLFYANEKN